MIIKTQHWMRLNGLKHFTRFHVYTFGAPPACSQDIADRFQEHVDGYIYSRDLVPRASYGAILDFRELVLFTNKIIKMSDMSISEKMCRIDSYRKDLVSPANGNPKHPKAVHVGTLFLITKDSRMNDSPNLLERKEDLQRFVVERSCSENFMSFHVCLNLMYHHFPMNYKKGLEGSLQT